ncbi:MAG: DUF1553 domain-containing protein, partial [Planctomycetales bacterium]|nr:DUF1553 domain-containing protein [Planctomycetales bacterium]
RSIYGLKLRGLLDPWQEVFNAPSPDLSCERRESSTVTPQAFALFNNRQVSQRSLALAMRLEALELDQGETIAQAFLLTLGRPPTEAEVAAFMEHWRAMTNRHQTLDFQADVLPTSIPREALEENTGEPFHYEEPLEVAAEFEPDASFADATPRTRGLAEVCLVLFNSNEFLYLD